MKIQEITPCSEISDKIIVRFNLDRRLNLTKLYKSLKRKAKFRNVIFFGKNKMIWLRKDMKSIIISGHGQIIVNTANDVGDALEVVEEIQRCSIEF